MKIESVYGRSILDSRGIPTVEATVTIDGAIGLAMVPSGTSTGAHEAKELRDGDRRWRGKGVSKAVSHVNIELAKAIVGKTFIDQAALDTALCETDGTPDKSRLGANAILAVSLASIQAQAAAAGQPLWKFVADGQDPRQLPLPLCNLINGGAHADNPLSIQEFMVVPHGFDTFHDGLRAVAETFYALGDLLKGRDLGTGVGAEGGYAPRLEQNGQALDLLVNAIEEAGYQPGKELSIALDVAATELIRDDRYVLDGQPLTADQMIAEYASLIERYPIVSIEDPLGEDDWEGWQRLHDRLGGKVQVVGDDLTVTNVERIGKVGNLIDAAILKPNQIGTYTETKAAAEALGMAKPIISHRSGETPDATIADLAVGWGAPMIKTGAVSRGERTAKYNRLLAIESQLGGQAVYAGPKLAQEWRKHG